MIHYSDFLLQAAYERKTRLAIENGDPGSSCLSHPRADDLTKQARLIRRDGLPQNILKYCLKPIRA